MNDFLPIVTNKNLKIVPIKWSITLIQWLFVASLMVGIARYVHVMEYKVEIPPNDII